MKLLRETEVCDRTGYSRQSLWRLERAGSFPARLRLGANRVAWLESDIDEWLAERIAERDRRQADRRARND